MIGEFFVILSVAAQLFPRSLFARADDPFRMSGPIEIAPFDQKRIAPMTHTLRIGQIESTLAHRQIVHRIEQIRLPGAVIPHQTVHARRKFDPRLGNILKIDQRKFLQIHKP